MKKTKLDFLHKKFQKCIHNSKKTWQLINSIIYGSKRKIDSEIDMIINDECWQLNDKFEIYNYLANFFSEIGLRLENSIPGPSIDPLAHVASNSASMYLNPVIPSIIFKTINSLKNSEAGADEISKKIVEETCHQIIWCFLPLHK